MGRRKPVKPSGFVLFDVFYEDGSRSSNRRVPAEMLGGLDGDQPARTLIETQDREIGQRSGIPRSPIKAVSRAAGR